MAETFVPVDLDKLLDDFEEQDSITSSEEIQRSLLTEGYREDLKGITTSYITPKESAVPFTMHEPHLTSYINGIDSKDFSSDDSSSRKLTKTSTNNPQSASVMNGINTNVFPSSDFTADDSALSCIVDKQLSRSLVSGMDADVVSRSSLSMNGTSFNVHNQQTTSTVDKISSEERSSDDVAKVSKPSFEPALEVNVTNSENHVVSPVDRIVSPLKDFDVDLLSLDAVPNVSDCSSIGDVRAHLESNSDKQHEETLENSTCGNLYQGLSNENNPKDNVQLKELSLPENVRFRHTRILVDMDNDHGVESVQAESIRQKRTDDLEENSNCATNLGTMENEDMYDRLNDETSCSNRTLNEETISPVPLTGEEEGTSSLVFMQDYFADLNVREETNNSNTDSVFEGGSTNNNDDGACEVDTSHEAPSQIIPVAQDAAALTEASLPLTQRHEQLAPDEPFLLGYSPPQWVPDSETNRCMSCHCKFTMVKRRHHCRACGKIFCSSCCNLKFNLDYLEDKLGRVCQECANSLLQRQANLTSDDVPIASVDESALYVRLNPSQEEVAGAQSVLPSSLASEVLPENDQQLQYEGAYFDNSSMSPNVSSLPSPPEDDVAETNYPSQMTQFRPTTCSSSSSLSSAEIPVTSTAPLPPLLRKTDGGLKIDNSPNHQEILHLLKKKKETVTFLLNKNLIVKVKIVKLSCCVKRKCWCFSSEGMGAADQEDMVILLECIPKEPSIPQDVLSHFNTAFAYAKQGHRVTDLGYTIFGQPFLGSLRNAGFLYIKSSFQCLENLILPSGPHIFGVLIQREEVSWVQLFPIRLILRLGAEYRYYPCPLWSVRDRPPLYGEIGHTIMDLLADFKNFQYTLPRVTGMHVHLEDKKTVIQLPQNRYDEVVKVLNATDEYVMAFEATFSNVADSHLVCIQDGTGYKTQSINIEGQERKVTGASFIVFNGALKTTTDVKAKVSIVEDGVMVQMVMQLSQEMRQAMREMRDFTINTGCSNSDGTAVQQVVIEWVTKRSLHNASVLSPIDGLTLGTTSDIKINTHFDYSTPSVYRLRWCQLFFLDSSEERPRNISSNFKQTIADVAKACTLALRSHLAALVESDKRRVGLRVNLCPDTVGYFIGSLGNPLPDEMMNDLDNELVPAIHTAANSSSQTPTSMEFVFNIIEMLS